MKSDTRTPDIYFRDALVIAMHPDLHVHTRRGMLHKLLHQDYGNHVRGLRDSEVLFWSQGTHDLCSERKTTPSDFHLEHVVPFGLLNEILAPLDGTPRTDLTRAEMRDIFDCIIVCWVTQEERTKLDQGTRTSMPTADHYDPIWGRYQAKNVAWRKDAPSSFPHHGWLRAKGKAERPQIMSESISQFRCIAAYCFRAERPPTHT